jgi:hypothetical protein
MGYYVNVYDGYTGQPIENAEFSDSWSGPGDYYAYRYYVEILVPGSYRLLPGGSAL